MRNDEKPFRIESSSRGEFRTPANGSYPEGIRLLLRISTGGRLWRSLSEVSQRKDAERRDKVSVRTGKDTRPRQDP
jgi:hypothetical protein